ncbi:serine hydrolase domain-containing protein [Actinacidiphila acidipaludis]|uniref:Beta-lactamase family protein n=1 Tax=Actinacidiphila acidipaludis TaxID=2873382 RepID=A0ABS7Q3B8_9ACTN|nr:serine hydrolase domain-containing protein [Streptomyces acidipaludis]MBY8877351.1 beta-lactamase family protein [Streptomyces acidipaludis]
MVSDTVLRDTVEWLLSALGGQVSDSDLRAAFAPRLTARGDLATMIAADPRLAGFGEHPRRVVECRRHGRFAARAVVRAGEHLWELDVAVEEEPPHRIRSFTPRRAASGAVPWDQLADRLRGLDRRESDLPGTLAERVHHRLREAVDSGRIVGLACAINVRGATAHREFFGTGDLGTFQPLDPTSVFRVGSVAKTVTGLAVLQLAEAGVIDLRAPLTDYLTVPELVPADPGDRPPTVAELLLHRAGLSKDLAVRRSVLQQAGSLAEAAPRITLAWAPGSRPAYSNVGYELLGLLVEQCTGEPFADHAAREVLARHHIHGAVLSRPTPTATATATATLNGHELVADRLAPVTQTVDPYRAAGGMTADLASAVALADLLGQGVGPLGALSAHAAPAGPGRRFVPGAVLLDRPEGALVWRGGSTRGFTAELLAAAGGAVSVALLATTSPAEGLREAAADVLRDVSG